MQNAFTWRLPCFTAWLLLTLSGLGATVSAQAPTWQAVSSPGLGTGSATTIDAAGNVYFTGGINGPATFGAFALNGPGAYVTKQQPDGTYEWVVSGGDAIITGVAVDGSGNVFVSGWFNQPTLTFGTITLIGSSTPTYVTNDGFVAKLSSAGVWQWGMTTSGGTTAEALAVDGSGNVYLAGTLDGSARFGTITVASAGSADGYVAKLNAAGDWAWAVGVGRTGYDYCLGLTVDAAGNAYASGVFESDSVRFGSTTLVNTTPSGSADGFVAKLNPAGVWQWATRIGGQSDDASLRVAVDGRGEVVVTGYFLSPTTTFGTITLADSTGGGELFVAKLTTAGAWAWATSAGGPFFDYATALTTDVTGNIYLTGAFESFTATFGTTTLTNPGTGGVGGFMNGQVFVARLGPTGTWEWAVSGGSIRNDIGTGIAVDRSGSIYVTGEYAGPATFGAFTLPATFESQPFLARLGPAPTGLPLAAHPVALTLSSNPAREVVRLTGGTGPTAFLLNSLGQKVRAVPLTEGIATFDVSALPAGVYAVRTGALTQRLVVE